MRRAILPLYLFLTFVPAGCGGSSKSLVNNNPGVFVSVLPAAPSLTVGDPLQLQVVPSPYGNNLVPTPTGTWTSSDTTVVTVSSGGLLFGIAEGSATVTFLCSSCPSVDVPVTVNPRASSLAITPSNATINAGSSFQFAANGIVNGKQQDLTNVGLWSIDNSLGGAASITGGLLTTDTGAVSTQTVIQVTVTYGGLKATVPAFVNP